MKRIALAAITAASLAPAALAQQVIVVNTVADIVDFSGAQQVPNLPGPDGRVSFREACIAANNTPGPQTIEFAIPQSEFWLVTNMALLRVENSPGGFSLTDNATTVDFTSQTRNIGNTNPDGNEVGIYSLMGNFTLPQAAITVIGSNCTINGLDAVSNFGYAIRLTGNNNRVIGCHIFEPFSGLTYAAVAIRPITSVPPTGNIIGGTNPGEGNVLASYPGVGIEITGPAADNVVIGNTLNRSHIAGLLIQAGANGTRVGGPTPPERNVIAGNGTGGGGIPQYSDIFMDSVNGTHIEGNYLGTSADGLTAAPAPAIGLEMHACNHTTILNNVISGYFTEGIHQGRLFRTGIGIYLTTGLGGIGSTFTTIQGNLIGVGADGVTPLPDAGGIQVASFFPFSMQVDIGGQGAGQGNTVAYNPAFGILVSTDVTGVHISGNSIHSNGTPDALFPARGLGIDLIGASGQTGLTPNDLGDADIGGNALQNFPVITTAQESAGGVHLTGSLNSLALQSFTIEFFASPACDPSGFGQGERYLGATTVITSALGNATFDVTVPASAAVGEAVTATASQVNTSNTSEFSACATVAAGPCRADFNHNGILDSQDFFDFLTAFFANAPSADFNHDAVVNSQDFFDFLSAFFAGC